MALLVNNRISLIEVWQCYQGNITSLAMISLFDTDSEDGKTLFIFYFVLFYVYFCYVWIDSLDGADTSQSEDGFVVKHIPMNVSYHIKMVLPCYKPQANWMIQF